MSIEDLITYGTRRERRAVNELEGEAEPNKMPEADWS